MLYFDVCAYDRQQIQNTRDLLSSIATHLSSKNCCRHRTYVVIVTDTTVTFDSNANLCRSRGDHKSAEPAIWHIMRNHFSSRVFHSLIDAATVSISSDSLVPGTYEYKSSVGGKQRRWFKVTDCDT